MPEPPTDRSLENQPAESMGRVAVWIILFLALIGIAFYCAQLIEELTGKKTVAKIALVAIAFAGSMLVRGGVWLASRLRGDSYTSQAQPTSDVE